MWLSTVYFCIVLHQNGIHFENDGHSAFENVIKEFLLPDNPIIDVSYDSLKLLRSEFDFSINFNEPGIKAIFIRKIVSKFDD